MMSCTQTEEILVLKNEAQNYINLIVFVRNGHLALYLSNILKRRMISYLRTIHGLNIEQWGIGTFFHSNRFLYQWRNFLITMHSLILLSHNSNIFQNIEELQTQLPRSTRIIRFGAWISHFDVKLCRCYIHLESFYNWFKVFC